MISIILSVSDEISTLSHFMDLLAAQSRQDYEIIFIDMCHDDRARRLIDTNHSTKILSFDPQKQSPGSIYNQAVKLASGDAIVFQDSRFMPTNEYWLENLLSALEHSSKPVAVYARQIAKDDALPHVAADLERQFGRSRKGKKNDLFFSLNSAAIPKVILSQHPFNEELDAYTELDWALKMHNRGEKIAYAKDAVLQYSQNHSLADLRKISLAKGRAEGIIYQDLIDEDPAQINFWTAVYFNFLAEYSSDLFRIIKAGQLRYLGIAKIYKFVQKYYLWKGRRDAYNRSKQKKRILLICTSFDQGKSGIAEYIMAVSRIMAKNHKLDILIHPKDKAAFTLTSPNIRFIIVPQFLSGSGLAQIWHLYILPLWPAIKSYDLVFIPVGNRRLLSRFPKNTVVTVHDLADLSLSGTWDFAKILYYKHFVGRYLHKAPRIFAISENTKRDIRRFFGVPGSNIEVNYNGYDPDKLNNPLDKADLDERFGISGKYMLYVARIEHPLKNHITLLKAFEALPDKLKSEYQLVCAGAAWDGSEKVMNYHDRMPDKKRILFTGHVQGADLAGLYKHASLFVFPSLYEGFGLPMLEAFASGLPVISANSGALPEIGKSAVLLFNPKRAQDISAAMQSVLNNPVLAEQLTVKAFKRLEAFSWERHCRRILDSIDKN